MGLIPEIVDIESPSAASDGNFVGAMGFPVLDVLGITGDGVLTLNEHILISDVAKRATLVTLLLISDSEAQLVR